MSGYPKWLYSATHEPALVQDEAGHKALGSGWFESPAEATASALRHAPATKAEPQTLGELAEDLGAKAEAPKHHKKGK